MVNKNYIQQNLNKASNWKQNDIKMILYFGLVYPILIANLKQKSINSGVIRLLTIFFFVKIDSHTFHFYRRIREKAAVYVWILNLNYAFEIMFYFYFHILFFFQQKHI